MMENQGFFFGHGKLNLDLMVSLHEGLSICQRQVDQFTAWLQYYKPLKHKVVFCFTFHSNVYITMHFNVAIYKHGEISPTSMNIHLISNGQSLYNISRVLCTVFILPFIIPYQKWRSHCGKWCNVFLITTLSRVYRLRRVKFRGKSVIGRMMQYHHCELCAGILNYLPSCCRNIECGETQFSTVTLPTFTYHESFCLRDLTAPAVLDAGHGPILNFYCVPDQRQNAHQEATNNLILIEWYFEKKETSDKLFTCTYFQFWVGVRARDYNLIYHCKFGLKLST